MQRRTFRTHGCFAALALGLSLAACGCHAPTAPSGKTAALLSVEDGQRFDHLWDATTSVLRARRFEPAWEDRGSGVIRTYPITTQQWLEWWRNDVEDGFSILEANLHTVRRTASIKMDRSPEPQKYIVSVQVDTERLSVPDRQATSPAGAIRMFSSGTPTTTGTMISNEKAQSWVPLGRDGNLEARLLAQIIRSYGPDQYEFVDVADPESGVNVN